MDGYDWATVAVLAIVQHTRSRSKHQALPEDTNGYSLENAREISSPLGSYVVSYILMDGHPYGNLSFS